ncbi:MAG: chemotaxis protein methyltransferase CheR, partial [Acidimicrobiaceae bacterium]|nr:chemotaxis protein methyltransferase CheR [Acidimicrobiaceae bacterium]
MTPAVSAAVADRMRDVGLKADVTGTRLLRAASDVAAERGVTVDALRGPALIDAVIERLLIHESWFFRDPAQFAALTAEMLPTLPRPVHVWSVGCGQGQEAWSVAMALAESIGADGWAVTATDLSGRALAAADRGTYNTAQLRGLSDERRTRFLEQVGADEWTIVRSIRPLVSFVQHNVTARARPVPAVSCQVVLCRNVLMYLHDEGVAAALASLGQAMTMGGWLMLGTAESLWGVTDAFEVVRVGEAYAYRQAGGSPAVEGRVAALPSADALVAQGASAASAGRHDEAATAFRQAAYLDPDRADAHAGLAAALEAVG